MGFYKGKNVLVTGAAGITGHAAVKRLLAEGANVRATVHSNRRLKIPPHDNLEVVKCDLMIHEDCMTVLEGIDVVFNFVAFIRGAKGQTEYGNALDLVRNNLFTSIK